MVEHQAQSRDPRFDPQRCRDFFSGENVRDLLILLPKISSKMAIQKQILPILVSLI